MDKGNGVTHYNVYEQWPTPHADNVLLCWNKLREFVQTGSIEINGDSLQVAAVVACARYINLMLASDYTDAKMTCTDIAVTPKL